MEVANFHSALTITSRDTDSKWLTSEASKDFILVLPDGTSLQVDVKVRDSSGLRGNDFIRITIWMNHKLIEQKKKMNGSAASTTTTDSSKRPIATLLDSTHFPLSIQCQPPKPKYKTSAEEPNDNSPAMRASRYAIGQIDLQRLQQASSEQILATIWVQLYVMMSLLPSEEAFNVALGPQRLDSHVDVAKLLIGAGLAIKHPIKSAVAETNNSTVLCPRDSFWQTVYPFRQSPWLLNPSSMGALSTGLPHPTSYTIDRNVYHPQRPTKNISTDGPVYTRYVLELGEILTFEIASSKDDEFVKLFTKWQNSDRVNEGWRQKGSEADHKRYLEQVEESEGTIGLIGKWDGQPWGYLEIYWAKESNIGPFYNAGDYDRGFHALVGEEKFRGPHRVRTWMGSVIHMMFLLDVRTQKVVLEPRASNLKMINYAQMCGAHVEKVSCFFELASSCLHDRKLILSLFSSQQLIDLPHKRAALVVCPREGFFQLCPLGPLPVQK